MVDRNVDSPVEVISTFWPLLWVVMTVVYCWTEVDTRADVLTTGVVAVGLDDEEVEAGGVLLGPADVGRLDWEVGVLLEGAGVEDGACEVGSLGVFEEGVGVAEVSCVRSVDESAEGVGVSEGSSLAPVPLASCLFPCTLRYSAMPSTCKASSILMAADRAMMAKSANKSHDWRIVLSMFGGVLSKRASVGITGTAA